MTLDETDRKLVALLRHDARRTATSLARALNLSRTAVQARIARLERDGIIQGYSATIAPDVVAGVQALVTLCLAVRPCWRITDPLLSWPEVERIYAIAGDWDAVLVVSDLADRLRAVEGIASVETTVILSARAGCPEKP